VAENRNAKFNKTNNTIFLIKERLVAKAKLHSAVIIY
jgi:hypothetical protein